MKYSIIIPSLRVDDYLRKCISEILKNERQDYEIIVCLASKDEVSRFDKTKIINTDIKNPSFQRNLAVDSSSGDVLVFIDSDAYPKNDFFEVLDKNFDIDKFNFVGGPNVTPKENSFFQKASGFAMSVAYPERHYPVGKKRGLPFLPSVNFSIKRDLFLQMSGFNSDFIKTSEDVDFCFRYIDVFKESIMYDPELIVYHNRRSDFFGFLKQYFIYGRDIKNLFFSDFNIISKNKINFNSIYFISLFSITGLSLLILHSVFLFLLSFLFYYIFGIFYYFVLLRRAEGNLGVALFGLFLFPVISTSYVFGFWYSFFRKPISKL